MATRIEDTADKTPAAAAVETPVTATPAAEAVAAAPVAKTTVKAAKPAAVKVAKLAKTAPAKKAVAAKIAKPVKAVKLAAKKVAVSKTAAPKAATKTTTIPSVAAAAEAAATYARKGQTMLTEATEKFTAEATKLTEEAKVRGEKLFTEAQVRAKEAATKGQEIAKEAVEFSKGNLEAMVEAGKIAAKGGEAIAQDLAAYAKQSFADTTAAAKRYAAVKSPTDFFQLQTELTKTAFDTMVKQGSKTTELSVKLANDAFQPISNRIALAVSKLKSAA